MIIINIIMGILATLSIGFTIIGIFKFKVFGNDIYNPIIKAVFSIVGILTVYLLDYFIQPSIIKLFLIIYSFVVSMLTLMPNTRYIKNKEFYYISIALLLIGIISIYIANTYIIPTLYDTYIIPIL